MAKYCRGAPAPVNNVPMEALPVGRALTCAFLVAGAGFEPATFGL
jgi:hypothetical protein